MKKFATIFLLLTFIVCLSASLSAQGSSSKIHPYLQMILLDASNEEMINVYATLNEQYPLDQLMQETYYLSKKEKQKEVVRILREFAFEKQSAVRQYLENAKQQNLVSRIDILWAANTIVFTAVPEVIYSLAENFDEIAEIRFDPVFDESLVTDPTEEPQEVIPGDVLAPQPGLVLINAPAVWAEGDSGAGVLTANHDSGCFWAHPDLINNIWHNLGEDLDNDGKVIEWNGSAWVFDPGDINNADDDANGYIDDFIGWDFEGNDNNPGPSGTHGTQTAGIICGDGTNGTQTGVAPRAKLINCKLSGESSSWLSIQYSVAAGVDVITSSHSWKWYFSPQPNYPMHRQLNDFELAAGVVHTNSTSNDGNSLGSAPIPFNIAAPGNSPPAWLHPDQTLIGGLSSVTGVGNVNASTDIIVSSSPYGPSTWEDIQINHPSYPFAMPLSYQDYPYETQPGSIGLLKPDVSAPGNGTVTTADGGGYASFSGTSGATPHVCGTAALLLSVNPNLTPAEVCMILQTTAVEKGAIGKDPRYGAGRIDAYQAYLLAVAMIPVELSSFNAIADGNSVTLHWSTATETNNQGFEIERSSLSALPVQNWEKIEYAAGFGTTTETKSYSFTDENLNAGSYSYRLKQVDYDGTVKYSNEIEVEVSVPHEFSLSQNYPNPFNPTTNFGFQISDFGMVTLKVYDVLGNEVATLVNEEKEPGVYEVKFDGSNLSSGLYFYKLQAGSFSEIKKMMLLK